MEKTYVIETSYKIKYTNKNPVPIAEIIDSLYNLEKILRRTPAFLERHYKGIKITNTEVFVSSVESGSLKEEFIIKYVFKSKENYEKAQEVIAQIIEDNEVIKILVAMGVSAMITWGVITAMSSNELKPTIEAYNNTIINIGADINFSAKDIEATLNALPSKKALVKEAINAVRPAKLENDATIEMGDMDRLEMPNKYIKEVPVQYEPPTPDEKSTKYTNIEVFIYASDRDNSEKGWGGIAPELFEHRVKFILADEVDPLKLHGRVKARADVVVHEKFIKEKKAYVVRSVEIVKVN